MTNDKIIIKIVKTADTGQLKILFREAGWWDEATDNKDPNLITKIIKGSFCFAVALIEGKIIGMGRAISDGVCDSYIQDVMVLEKFRGIGVGTLIMNELIKYLRNRNINWISLISEPKAVRFYQNFGFSQMTDHIPFKLL